jgi:DNA (cytosine-5)-methyltransferase 1
VAIDIEPTLQSGYKLNFPKTLAVQASVADIDAATWKMFIGKVRPDVVIGGPPCQGFSWIGKRRTNDPRNSLLHHFYRHVRLLRPKVFVMENVGGLLDVRNRHFLQTALEQVAGRYRVLEPHIVNAADFGAATNRKRVVVVGYDPSEVDEIDAKRLFAPKTESSATVRDAISDLPAPIIPSGEDLNFGWAKYPAIAKRHISGYATDLRRKAPKGLGWAEALELHERGYISGLHTTHHSREVARRYAQTPMGGTDKKTKSYKLEWNGICPTLRAGTGRDKGSFQAVRPLHPGKARVITVREAARLQGFPDWFVFHHTKWHSFRMIGNSVSPSVSKTLLARIRRKLAHSLA